MTLFFLLPFIAGASSLLLAVIAIVRKQSAVSWCFFGGMTALALDSICTGLNLRETRLGGDVDDWLFAAFVAKSFVPVFWVAFSVMYSRSSQREFLSRWRGALALFAAVPLAAAVSGGWTHLEGVRTLWWLQSDLPATTLNIVLLLALILILANLEQTFRAAVGTMRWRIKFVVVALGVIFGARLYVRSQAILFYAPDIASWSVESGALLIGCVFLTMAYVRTGLVEIDVYPSLGVLRSSVTVLAVGAYLVAVGVAAQVVSRVGGAEIFQFQAGVVLLGASGLAVLLLSDRARHRIRIMVARNFTKARHDSLRIWTLCSQSLARMRDQAGLCGAAAKFIAETFDVLSVTVWLLDEHEQSLVAATSTGHQVSGPDAEPSRSVAPPALAAGLRARRAPFDLDAVDELWANELRRLSPTTFPNGGSRLCVPLCSGAQVLGAVVLADRVSGTVYSVEETELLKCVGDQLTSALVNLRLGDDVARAKELEAFQTMSAFFVHDLKNAASSFTLMLNNLPQHFDDPEFRDDALRSMGNTARRIEDMIARLGAIRRQAESRRIEADLNQVVSAALERVNGMSAVELIKELEPVPAVMADPEQLESVVTNLVVNARDAINGTGQIRVRTERRDGRIILSVADNGCGMTPAFVKESLFRPFQSTKKKGLGIGLFQSRQIVQAHGGGIRVASQAGKGTTFVVSLPVNGK